MAMELLNSNMNGDLLAHAPYHDLESFFYVLLYISTWYNGPRRKETKDADDPNHPFSSLFGKIDNFSQNQRFQMIANTRKCFFLEVPLTREILKKHVTPYFQCLIPLLENLVDTMFKVFPGSDMRKIGVHGKFTHEEFLKTLQNAYDGLSDDPCPVPPIPEDASPTNSSLTSLTRPKNTRIFMLSDSGYNGQTSGGNTPLRRSRRNASNTRYNIVLPGSDSSYSGGAGDSSGSQKDKKRPTDDTGASGGINAKRSRSTTK